GIREIVLVSHDLAGYTEMESLLKKIAGIKSDFWIRLLYLHPAHIKRSLLTLIKNEKKILPYFDIPVQHISDPVLARMRRKTTEKNIYALFERIKKEIPEAILRTTLLTGFPGETEKDFSKLIRFAGDLEFDYLGVFAYSREYPAAAASFPGQVSGKTKQERKKKLLRFQEKIVLKKNRRWLNKTVRTLALKKNRCRTWFQAPEIDGETAVEGRLLKPGNFYKLRITFARGYELAAE
ncbi:MAG TPA: radical SAM protein, partial [bacterium]|nr:radical SAM protein [bacterium]